MSDLVLDIGNSRLKGAIFKEDRLAAIFALPSSPLVKEELKTKVKQEKFERVLISSVNTAALDTAKALFDEEKLPYYLLNYKDLKVQLEVEEPEKLGTDRIANVYGALHYYPSNDCIVIDIGTAVTFDYVTKDGKYIGGAIHPGTELCAKALSSFTDLLPLVAIEKPENSIGKTTKSHIQSGIYYGLLGAIERICAELRANAPSPSSLCIVATGGAVDTSSSNTFNTALVGDLTELVDKIDPHLTLVGLHDILKEKNSKTI